MSLDDTAQIDSFLLSRKDEFISKWCEKVHGVLNQIESGYQKELVQDEFEQLFNVYIEDISKGGHNKSREYLINLIDRKMTDGFRLSTLELINASFMDIARLFIKERFPDAYNKRTECLESISQMILNHEVMLATHYENYLNDLTNRLIENSNILKRHNSSLVEFIDVATHQLQSPLWSILGFVSKLQRKYYDQFDEYGRHCLNRITANVSDMHQLIEDVTTMLVIDQGTMTHKRNYLVDLLDQARKRVIEEIDKNFVSNFTTDCKNYIIEGDPYHLKQLFYQIFKNAAQFTSEKKSSQIAVSCSLKKDFHIYLEDNGIGIIKRYRELVFKPMERLKEKEVSGSGMGLTFARRIVVGHGGTINIEDPASLGGISVHIMFPSKIINKIS